jgi:hypothetical protein
MFQSCAARKEDSSKNLIVMLVHVRLNGLVFLGKVILQSPRIDPILYIVKYLYINFDSCVATACSYYFSQALGFQQANLQN